MRGIDGYVEFEEYLVDTDSFVSHQIRLNRLSVGPHVASPINSDASRLHFVPIGQIFPGFALNTIFYAAILWLLFAAPGAVRRRIRTKRGQCPACAYPIGTNKLCTECGTRLPGPSGVTDQPPRN